MGAISMVGRADSIGHRTLISPPILTGRQGHRGRPPQRHYDFWRPITAIRNGDVDDNPGTERDASWQPLEATPMHPEYPCAHCIQSGSVAAVVKAVLGTVDISEVALTSPTAPGVTHRWTNLDEETVQEKAGGPLLKSFEEVADTTLEIITRARALLINNLQSSDTRGIPLAASPGLYLSPIKLRHNCR